MENLDEGGSNNASPARALPIPNNAEAPDSTTRRYISYWLLALLAAVVLAGFIGLFIINGGVVSPPDAAADADRLMRLMNVVFGPVVTLFSSVVGFYFGARTARESVQG